MTACTWSEILVRLGDPCCKGIHRVMFTKVRAGVVLAGEAVEEPGSRRENRLHTAHGLLGGDANSPPTVGQAANPVHTH